MSLSEVSPGVWNPRFVLYARAHGHAPRLMAEVDRRTWPGDGCGGFALWLGGRWRAYAAAHGIPLDEHMTDPEYGTGFDRWLPGNLGPES